MARHSLRTVIANHFPPFLFRWQGGEHTESILCQALLCLYNVTIHYGRIRCLRAVLNGFCMKFQFCCSAAFVETLPFSMFSVGNTKLILPVVLIVSLLNYSTDQKIKRKFSNVTEYKKNKATTHSLFSQ